MIPEYRIGHLRQALGHRYEFEAFLGRGAFATVLLVRNRKLGRREALKVLQESFDGDHEFAKRFVEEARLVASLDHPHIVKVYDYGDVDGVLWYSMQYIGGPSLGAELEARRPLESREVISLAVPLLDALAYSHDAGVVHRDVKPGNVMLSAKGRPYLMDFGIAKVQDGGFKTATGSVLGTPAYISPEQASGDPVDGRSDVYSLGVCLYQMATGVLPFPASDPIRMLMRRLTEEPEPPSVHWPSIDPRFEDIILKSLARSVDDRFQGAGAMRRALLQAFRHQVDAEAVRVTAQVAEPAPLGATQVARPGAGVDLGDSEAPTIITEPAAEGDAEPQSRKLPIALLIAAILLVATAAVFLLRPHSPPTGAPPLEEQPTVAVGRSSDAAGPPLDGNPVSTSDAADDASADAGQPAETQLSPGSAEELTPPPGTTPDAAAEVTEVESPAEPPRKRRSPPAAARTAKKPTPEPTQQAPPPPRRAVDPPAILDAPAIELPPELAALCSGLDVILTATIGGDGELLGAKMSGTPEARCAEAARRHLERYRFQPGTDFAGDGVPAKLTLSIRFP